MKSGSEKSKGSTIKNTTTNAKKRLSKRERKAARKRLIELRNLPVAPF